MHGADGMQVQHTITAIESQRAVWIAGAGCLRNEVFGEEYNQQHMGRIAASVNGRSDVPVAVWLVPESEGVAVWGMGAKVGYLPPAIATVWHPVLRGLNARYNLPVACQATLDVPSASNNGVWGMVVWLPAVQVAAQPTAPVHSAATPAEIGALRAELDKTKQELGVAMAKARAAAQLTDELVHSAAEISALRAELDKTKQELVRRSAESVSTEVFTRHQAEASALRTDLGKAKQQLEAAMAQARAAALPVDELAKVSEELQRLRAEIEVRRSELRSVEEALEIQSFGFYKPKYGFESSAQYIARLQGIRDEQQRLIKDDLAAPCDTKWTVGGSAAEGKKMVKQQAKLMLRAFNGECDAAITKVRYDNVVTMERRLEKAYADINKLGEVQRVFISRRYLDLKLAELHLVYEHREKVEEEKQEQKRIRDQMREEQKVQADIERAKADAEKEQAAATAALEKARAELVANMETSKQHEKLEALVSRLENELKDALDRKAKAIARAQLTRSGHVYVLSNVGSFGENIYKIGMTRRLDPFERVEELGDASVPFPFDVHAVIFAEDAPGLENKLHQAFASRRVNLVNLRKEYFRVTLEEIQEEVKKHHGFVSLTLTAEAEEYRKSLAARNEGIVPELAAPMTSVATGLESETE
jgi:hypothetical protein